MAGDYCYIHVNILGFKALLDWGPEGTCSMYPVSFEQWTSRSQSPTLYKCTVQDLKFAEYHHFFLVPQFL